MDRSIIIWGKDDFNVLGLLRQLAVAGLKIVFMSHGGAGGCATKSRYCKEYIIINTLQEGKSYLLERCKSDAQKSIVICSDDEIAEFLDEEQEVLSPYYIIPRAKRSYSIASITDKCTMTKIAEEVGFLIPRSIDFYANTALDEVFFPCLLKPARQIRGKYNEFKTRICKSKRTLFFTQLFLRKESKYILQEIVPLEKVSLVYGCVLQNNEVLIAGVLEKDRFAANGDGSHGTLRSTLPAYLDEKIILKFIHHIGYYGLFSIEFGVCKNMAYFFEINLRNDGTSHYFYQAGANIPLAWVKDALGEEIFSISTQIAPVSYFIDELEDRGNVTQGKISKEQWMKDKAKATVFKYYDSTDIEPYLQMKRGHVRKRILNRFLSKYRLYLVWIFDRIGVHRK